MAEEKKDELITIDPRLTESYADQYCDKPQPEPVPGTIRVYYERDKDGKCQLKFEKVK